MTEMGNYEILSHTEMPECSVRLIRVGKEKAVDAHLHQESTQVYVLLEGRAEVTISDHTRTLRPYETVRIPKKTVHSIRSEEGALALSISIPPLQPGDQHPVS